MTYATITGTGANVPDRVVTNAELSAILGEDIDHFVRNTLGIVERRWAGAMETPVDIAVPAALRALAAAGVAAEEIDLLIVATDTPQFVSPATAALLQARLGSKRAAVFDVNAACAGFVTALDIAWKYLSADDRYRRILVVGVYLMSKYLNQKDKKTLTIFADGAGAVVVERSPLPGVLASELIADGSFAHDMGVFDGTLQFVRKYPPQINEEGWPRIVRAVLQRIGKRESDVSLWLWTQVNRSTIQRVMAALGEPMEKTHTIMDRVGYTGSACIPMALDDAVRNNRLEAGDLVIMTGSGAGLTMGTVALQWTGTK